MSVQEPLHQLVVLLQRGTLCATCLLRGLYVRHKMHARSHIKLWRGWKLPSYDLKSRYGFMRRGKHSSPCRSVHLALLIHIRLVVLFTDQTRRSIIIPTQRRTRRKASLASSIPSRSSTGAATANELDGSLRKRAQREPRFTPAIFRNRLPRQDLRNCVYETALAPPRAPRQHPDTLAGTNGLEPVDQGVHKLVRQHPACPRLCRVILCGLRYAYCTARHRSSPSDSGGSNGGRLDIRLVIRYVFQLQEC
jgi:hypothetical protein